MYRILHLYRVEKFTNDYLKFIYTCFNDNYHEFWIYGDRNSNIRIDISLYKNAKYVRNIIEKLKGNEIYKFDKIIYHGMFEQDIIDFFFWNRKLLKRLYILFWGGDKFYVQDRRKNFRKKYVIRNVHGLINILPEEKRFLQKNYSPKGTFFCTKYCGVAERPYDVEFPQKEEKSHIAIQIGNSATKTNRHIAILKQLSKFKDENIKIYAPLSYGDPMYAKMVIEEGKKIFDKKFVGITEFMDAKEYWQFLNNMDIAIFGMNRQQALGNICVLLYYGKKIFLKDYSVLTHFFRTKTHCNINTIDEITQMKYEEFIEFPEEYKRNNKERITELVKPEPIINDWNIIFNEKLSY